MTAVSAPWNTEHTVAVPRVPACGAGLLAAAVCLLTGLAVGALCTRPVLRGRGWSTAVTLLVAVLSLVTTGSPAKPAVTGLVTGSETGRVPVPLLPFAAAIVIAVAASAVASFVATRRE